MIDIMQEAVVYKLPTTTVKRNRPGRRSKL